MHRRRFLREAAALGASTLIRCDQLDGAGAGGSHGDRDGGRCPGDELDASIGAASPGAEVVPFEDEAGPFGVAEGSGLDGRLYTDLSRLDAEHPLTDSASFYVRTRYPDANNPADAPSLTLGGRVVAPLTLALSDVLALETDQGVHLLECSGNFRERGFGLMSAAAWHGVQLSDLLTRVEPAAGAARVLITGSDAHSRPSSGSTLGASWIVSPEQLAQTRSFLATRMNGAPLPLDHGYPLRLVNPGWYGCSAIKWVQSIEWVADDAASTSQMIEFSSRTHQVGVPALARDYAAPEIQPSAMPIRIEKRRSAAGVCYRVVGIVWGGSQPVRTLGVSFDGGARFEALTLGAGVSQNRTWSLWERAWAPAATGRHEILCRIEAPDVPTRRLDSRYYRRSVIIDEV
jgi:DMSO/TMAO reductase YedYZ molybdopterin-dependent catalytic subunit